MTAEYDDSFVQKLAEQILKTIAATSKMASADLEGNLSRKANVDKGKLQGSWFRTQLGSFRWMIWSGAEYAEAVSEGWAPFTIYPNTAEVLAFKWQGAPAAVQQMFPDTFPVVFFKSIEHPGYEGSEYIDEAIEATSGRVDEFVEYNIEKVFLG